MRRTSSRLSRVISWACCSSARSGSGARSATRFRPSSTAVRLCPTSSCSSWAMRRRSASWADRARALLVARSVSRRSSIALNVLISSANPPCPATGSRCPGRSRSTVVIRRVSRSRGARPIRSSAALATSMTARPPTRMTASVSSTGTDTVTGAHNSSAVAAPSTTAFSPKIRQNNDTVCRASSFPPSCYFCPSHYRPCRRPPRHRAAARDAGRPRTPAPLVSMAAPHAPGRWGATAISAGARTPYPLSPTPRTPPEMGARADGRGRRGRPRLRS